MCQALGMEASARLLTRIVLQLYFLSVLAACFNVCTGDIGLGLNL